MTQTVINNGVFGEIRGHSFQLRQVISGVGRPFLHLSTFMKNVSALSPLSYYIFIMMDLKKKPQNFR